VTALRLYHTFIQKFFAALAGIRANPNLGTTGFVNGINSAILRYVGAPVEEPAVTTFEPSSPLNEADLKVGPEQLSLCFLFLDPQHDPK